VRLLALVSLNIVSLNVVSLGLGPAAASAPPWTWPVDPVQVVVPYVAPAHAYGAGHRGIDVAADGDVHAPADGVVAFSGRVVDRDVLTIDVGDGVVVTFEPVTSALPAGTPVRAGDLVAGVGSGGHSAPGTLHIGVRESGAYVNPLRYLDGVPRAILLPCC
jgi:murein DD-endopeptidase MepM/ murein hydrolase activator NlpD